MIKKVIIASQNPVKINSVRIWFEKMFPLEKFEFEWVSIPSNVNKQPINNKETYQGALNRVNNAKNKFKEATFWIGIEWGIEKINNEMETFAWIIIRSNNTSGKSKTGTFFLPKKIIEFIDKWKELGEANDIVFKSTNSKQKNGTVGILTENIITRTSFYTEAVILALIPFKDPTLY